MALSVQQGTSRHSKVQGYSSGGKTGTAEKYPRGNGKYLVSFIGFAPVDDPAVVIYVVVDEPNAEDQANSTYPQYIAQGILSELLPYLNVVPDESEDGTVPETELWEGFKGHLKSTSISDSELDSDGNLVDADGNLIDWDGNRIDENGYLLDANGDHILDEEGNYKMSTNLVSASEVRMQILLEMQYPILMHLHLWRMMKLRRLRIMTKRQTVLPMKKQVWNKNVEL